MAQEYKQLYLDFDQYIRQGEAGQKDRAQAWRTAIGLQAVDGLKTSEYLQQTALRNIEGEITIEQARELVRQYYITKAAHDSSGEDNEEADKVSANTTKILSSDTLDLVQMVLSLCIAGYLTAYSSTQERFAIMTSQKKNGCWKETLSVI